MSKKWYNRLVLGTAAFVFCGLVAAGQFAVAQNPGQLIVTTLAGTELVAVQGVNPQSTAITANNLAAWINAGGGGASPGAFTTLSASGAVSGAGFTARFAVPGPIGNTTPSTGAFTTLSASSGIDTTNIGATTPGTGKFTTLAWTGLATGTFGTDSGQTATASVCEDTTTHAIYFGSGAAGICKGTSSIRFKQNIGQIAYGLPQVMKLQPVSYYTKPGYGDPDKKLFGFLAEDMVSVMPEGVTEYDPKGSPSSVDYIGMIPVLVKAIQEQQAQIEQLKHQLSARR